MDVSQGSGQDPSRATRNENLRGVAAAVNKSQRPYTPDPIITALRRDVRDEFARITRISWLVVAGLLGMILGLLVSHEAKADIISEIGGGVKNPRTTSYVLREECNTVYTYPRIPFELESGFRRSCGGDNPVFVGWPIAYQSPTGNWRVGWFHMSHWFDGGSSRETHFDCVCASWTVNWSSKWRNRK